MALALAAMGGRERIEAVKTLKLEGIQHTLLVEQSYRQDPFITAYARTRQQLDFTAQRMQIQTHLTWPESDPGQAGANRMELYPLRGASTERQYMVYFPEHQLLYATVFAMHQEPVAWAQVTALVERALN